jgi:hypothetical protein
MIATVSIEIVKNHSPPPTSTVIQQNISINTSTNLSGSVLKSTNNIKEAHRRIADQPQCDRERRHELFPHQFRTA